MTEVVALEGSVLVNIAKKKTFYSYEYNIIFPIVKSELIKHEKVDLVLIHSEISLKLTATAKSVITSASGDVFVLLMIQLFAIKSMT